MCTDGDPSPKCRVVGADSAYERSFREQTARMNENEASTCRFSI